MPLASRLLPWLVMAKRGRTAGFTLIELLVVVSIVAILAAIAIPQFATRQGKAYDARVVTDTRGAAAGQEAYFVDHLRYSSDCTTLPGFTPSAGVTFTQCEGDSAGFRLSLTHPQATKQCSWDSVNLPQLACAPR